MKVRISFTVSRTFHNIQLLVVLISDDFDNTLIFSLVSCTLKKKKKENSLIQRQTGLVIVCV